MIITPTRVQTAQTTSGSSTSGTVTFGKGVGFGNLIYLVISVALQGDPTGSASGLAKAVEDTGNGTANMTHALWSGVVGQGGIAPGTTAFIMTWSGTHSFVIYAEEWRAPYGWIPSPFDVAKHTNGAVTGTTFDSGLTAITTQAAEFLVASHGYRGATQALSNITPGWTNQTNIANGSNVSIAPYVQAVGANTTAEVKATVGVAAGWSGLVATFKLAVPPYVIATRESFLFPAVTGAAIINGTVAFVANAALAETAQVVAPTAPLIANSLISESARVLGNATAQANTLISESAKVVGSAAIQANTLLSASGTLKPVIGVAVLSDSSKNQVALNDQAVNQAVITDNS